MSISAHSDDHWNLHNDARQPRIAEDIAFFVASLLINVVFVLVMILEGEAYLEAPSNREISIELIVAPPPPEVIKPQQRQEQIVEPQDAARAAEKLGWIAAEYRG